MESGTVGDAPADVSLVVVRNRGPGCSTGGVVAVTDAQQPPGGGHHYDQKPADVRFCPLPGSQFHPAGLQPRTLQPLADARKYGQPSVSAGSPGFDRHSITYATPTAPYLRTPQSLNINSFKVNPASPVAHAGIGRAMCGALDGSGTIGCDF